MTDPRAEAAGVEAYLRRARRELLPKLRRSQAFLSICPSAEDEPDLQFALELGLAVLLDKPILAVVPKGRTCPPGVARIAHIVLENVDIDNPLDSQRVQDAVNALLGEFGEIRP